MSGYGTLSVLGTVLCMFISPGSGTLSVLGTVLCMLISPRSGTLSILGTVLCVLISPRSSQWFQTVVWSSVTAAWWQTRRGTVCQGSLRKSTASKFTSAEYELAVPGGNFLEVYKSEDTESEGPWSQPRQAITRRRLELRCNDTRLLRAEVKSLRTAGQNSS